MPIHTRPPAPKTPVQPVSNPTTYLAPMEPHPAPSPGRARSESDSRAESSRAQAARVAPAVAGETRRPWYRAEPWLVVMLSAFVPVAASFAAPDAFKLPLVGLAALALLVATGMLIRHGATQPHPELPFRDE